MVKPERSSEYCPPGPGPSDPKYKGVRKRKWGKWVSEIRLPNSRDRIWLGSYDSPLKAARAFDAALFCLRGANAKFNFPHQPPDIPGGTSLPHSQIQAAAARFANSLLLPSSSSNCTTTTTTDDNSSSSCCFSSSPSPSPSVSDQLQLDPSTITLTTSPFLHDFSYMNLDTNTTTNTTTHNFDVGVPDFGIYPGFDDYFMTTPTTATDYDEEENSDGIYLQGSSFLWNF